jgi:oligo-1,6-glucosidase
VHDNRNCANVKTQQENADSILGTYRELLKIRREQEPLQNGALNLLDGPEIDPNLLAYTRENDSEKILVVINFGKKAVAFKNETGCDQVLLALGIESPPDLKLIELPPYSGIILKQPGA